jgi:DNA adenine methylase
MAGAKAARAVQAAKAAKAVTLAKAAAPARPASRGASMAVSRAGASSAPAASRASSASSASSESSAPLASSSKRARRAREADEPLPEARPFLKWVGGKRRLLVDLEPHIPKALGTYHEPFVGGGALFFRLAHRPSVLSDTNERLIRTYLGVRDEVEHVIDRLRRYPHDKDFFLRMRARPIDRAKTHAEVAAWMIYLNKTGYNGLYRVNSKNLFNVPFGDYARPTICDAPLLRACSRALAGVELRVDSFERVLSRAKRGDFVYFDPPYVPLSASSSFTSYTSRGFDMREQVALRDVAATLRDRGVSVLLSNSAAPAVRELYREGFHMHEVLAARAINSRGDRRGRIAELVLWAEPKRLRAPARRRR